MDDQVDHIKRILTYLKSEGGDRDIAVTLSPSQLSTIKKLRQFGIFIRGLVDIPSVDGVVRYSCYIRMSSYCDIYWILDRIDHIHSVANL